MRYWLTLISISLLSSFTTACFADTEATATVKAPLSSDTLVDTLLGLGLVIALILGLAWLIKRTGKFQSSSNGAIKIVAGLSLGSREKALLLEVEGEKILIGVTPQQINTLHILGRDDEPKRDHDKYAQFDQQLQHILAQSQHHD